MFLAEFASNMRLQCSNVCSYFKTNCIKCTLSPRASFDIEKLWFSCFHMRILLIEMGRKKSAGNRARKVCKFIDNRIFLDSKVQSIMVDWSINDILLDMIKTGYHIPADRMPFDAIISHCLRKYFVAHKVLIDCDSIEILVLLHKTYFGAFRFFMEIIYSNETH